MLNFSRFIGTFGDEQAGAVYNPPAKSMQTDSTEAARPTKLALLVMADSPTTDGKTTNTPSEKGEIVQFLVKMKTEASPRGIDKYLHCLTCNCLNQKEQARKTELTEEQVTQTLYP